MASWLSRQRKDDLKDLADEAGFKGAGSLTKTDLVPALDEFLRANESSLKTKPNFADYFASSARSASEIKKESKETVASAVDTATKAVKQVKRRVTKAADELAASASPSGTNVDPAAPAAHTRSHTTPRSRSRSLAGTPRAVAQAAEQRVSNFYNKYAADYVDDVQEFLSTAQSIQFATLLVEGLSLLSIVLPTGFSINWNTVRSPIQGHAAVGAPDLNKLLSSDFWSPVGLWFLTSIVLPLVVGFLFNLTQASGVSRKHGKDVDPVSFSVTKALLAWLIYDVGTLPLVGSISANAAVQGVRGAGFGVRGIYISSAVGALAGIYEAILRK